jgi:hypothetical protein
MIRLRRLGVKDPDTSRALDDLRLGIEQLSDRPDADCVIVENVQLVDGQAKLIAHGLDRAWRGWTICNLEGPSSTGRIEHVKGENKTKFLQLKATGWGATITINVKVF